MNSSQSVGNDRPDQLRRRLARGGMAGTVLLGSLISRPVLGNGSGPPYDCTISGQLSGNMSPRTGDGIACNSLGKSPAQWITSVWPSGVTKGSMPTATVSPFPHPFPGLGTYFNLVLGFATSFTYDTNGSVVYSTVNDRQATLLQVLQSPNADPLFNFAREAIAALLNAIHGNVGPAEYPLTQAEVVAMYNAVHRNSTDLFVVNTSISWNRGQVETYFRSLRAV